MKFEIQHPTHHTMRAEYGFDEHLDFFVEVIGKHGRRVEYDARFGDYADLVGAIAFLAKAGFFASSDVTEALVKIEHEDGAYLPEHLRRIVDVVWNFKSTADW